MLGGCDYQYYDSMFQQPIRHVRQRDLNHKQKWVLIFFTAPLTRITQKATYYGHSEIHTELISGALVLINACSLT